jgi:hypothetical protein
MFEVILISVHITFPNVKQPDLHFNTLEDHLCDLVVRASGYRLGGLGFDSRLCQIFCEAVSGTRLIQLREHNLGDT